MRNSKHVLCLAKTFPHGYLGSRKWDFVLLVVLKSDDQLMAVEEFIDANKCIIWVGPKWSAVLGKATPTFQDTDCFRFVDGQVMGERIVTLASSILLTKITSMQRVWPCVFGWNTDTWQVDHHLLGSVTMQRVHITGHLDAPFRLMMLPIIVG
jgi:hypothetical protein